MRHVFAIVIVFLALGRPAAADDLRPGYLEWRERSPGEWVVTWKAPLLGGLATRAEPIVPGRCAAEPERRRFEGPSVVEVSTVRCIGPLAGQTLGLRGLEQGFTDALLRVAPLDAAVATARLTPDNPTSQVPAQASSGSVAATYLRLGIEHIVGGFDHLLFVVALVLLLRGWRQIVATVTAFTLAHSITLAVAALGALSVARKPVEICIALSIVLVAREVLRPSPSAPTLARRAPAAIAFAFGLLHGLGFAAALSEIGLPTGEIPLALLTFNIGVEVGQLAIVAATLATLAGIAKLSAQMREQVPRFAAYAIGAIASAWVIERLIA